MPHFYETNHLVNSEYRKEYLNFVDDHLSEGINGYEQKAWFIRPGVLRQWWTQRGSRRIPRLLDYRTYIGETVIIESYLIIFSILVYIGQPQYIDDFVRLGLRDVQLPLPNDMNNLGGDPHTTNMLDSFRKYQWKFCPVYFTKGMVKKKIDPRQILPIKKSRNLRSPMDSNMKTIINATTFYADCFDPSWNSQETIVFKQFRTNENNTLRYAWRRECNAMNSIGDCKQTVRYLGSFEQNDRCFVMSEYANGGSLLDLFKRDIRPQTTEEINRFWTALTSLLKAINRFHNLKFRAEEHPAGFAHRDINPENILVFYDEDDPFSDDFTLKLTDFETATAAQVIDKTELSPHDNDGNRTYSAPEASRAYGEQESDLLQLPFHCDIWSLGCVLAEALVWLGGGREAIQAAEHARRNSITTHHSHLVGGGYSSCFHDGVAVLKCVLYSNRDALANLLPTDNISHRMSNIIERHMLQPSNTRTRRSMDIWNEFNKLFKSSVASSTQSPIHRISPISLALPATMGKGSSYGDVTTITPPPRSKLRDIQNLPDIEKPLSTSQMDPPADSSRSSTSTYREPVPPQPQLKASDSLKSTKRPSPNGPGPSEATMSTFAEAPSDDLRAADRTEQKPHSAAQSRLFQPVSVSEVSDYRHKKWHREEIPGYQEFKKKIGERHFLIIIDDSITMRSNDQVLEVAETLAWLVKSIDSSRVEIRLASNPTKSYNTGLLRKSTAKRFKPIHAIFRAQGAGGRCNMEFVLNRILNERGVITPDHPTSVLVLTDGIWEGGTNKGDNIRGSVAGVLKKMQDMNLARTDFTIQFVSFGDNEAGIARLQYVDDHPPLDSQGEKRDIVDHKRHTDNIWEILWGAASDEVDKQ
ncbi:hypothetical protein FGRMN_8482 [Fusarium graminum]|nr:hypothetical protein FGRMN_8482 [Fusarium graminum]